jgi:hypothetical protein
MTDRDRNAPLSVGALAVLAPGSAAVSAVLRRLAVDIRQGAAVPIPAGLFGEIAAIRDQAESNRQAELSAGPAAFVVVAGRWDDGERNTKLISEPLTLDAALVEYAACACYPWRHIEYKGVCLDVWEPGQ